ncbi:MAG TPA: VWA domain-containing protein [Pyrinomonadaceae bacterium]|nr:VWA domain-containing protein [Pyrinomonadaceae bacterium]
MPVEQEDVLRINTELVQTDVMVFDKQGHFVNDLRPEDFELRIDGKLLPISFLELVSTGSLNEESQLAATRSSQRSKAEPSPLSVDLDRRRVIFFYVDDLHLAANNLVAARKLLVNYLEKDMRQNDEAAITSASGQIGFLQQLTDNKLVLHAAIDRLKVRPHLTSDSERPAMSEYQALAIERNNHDVVDFFVDELMKDLPNLSTIAAPGGLPRGRAEQRVRDRAHTILQQASAISINSLLGLESLVRSSSKLPGRKLIFFISDGFFLDDRNSNNRDELRHITSLAARSGAVIYSIDARGLVASLTDASSDVSSDPSGRLQRIAGGELVESQDAMNALARDTGGRPIFNTNALDAGVTQALQETSNYYLVAWRPESNEQKSEKFRHIEVNVVGRPELSVRVRKGFFDLERARVTAVPQSRNPDLKTDQSNQRTAETQIRSAINAPFPERGLPVSLSLTWTDTAEKRQTLNIAVQVNGEALSFEPEGDKRKAIVDVAGSVYNEEGKAGASFGERLTVTDQTRGSNTSIGPDLVYGYPLTLPPGLYQVRVAVREEKNGRIGSTQQWIEIPDLSAHKVVLSSVILSERIVTPPAAEEKVTSAGNAQLPRDRVTIRVDHRFHRNSFLRFLVFIYTSVVVRPDIAVQIQILRSDQPVITTALRKVSTEGTSDLGSLPYAADISLEQLPTGRYMLVVTAIDRTSQATTSQSTYFEVE